jgi:hypothetical protein
MGVQARQLARFAKKNNIKVERSGMSFRDSKAVGHCIKGVICHLENVNNPYEVSYETATQKDLLAMECGFEGWIHYKDQVSKRSYKLGENFARLMGL